LQKADFYKEDLLGTAGLETYYILNIQRQVIESEIIHNIYDEDKLKTDKSKVAIPVWSKYYTMMTEEWFPQTGYSVWVFSGKSKDAQFWIEAWVNKRWKLIKQRFKLSKSTRFHNL